MSDPKIDRSVTIDVDGEQYILQPTVDAMIKINRLHRSILRTIDSVRDLDFVTVCAVISAGASLTAKQSDILQGRVFRHGILETALQLPDYLDLLLDPTGRGDDAENDQGKD